MKGRVLSVASECVPFVKTGGLADVVGALPQALAAVGWEMKVLIPAYRALRPLLEKMDAVLHESGLFGGDGTVYAGRVEGIDLLVLDAPHLYDRDGGPYGGPGGDWWDNPQRFAALSWMGARIAREGIAGWRPDVLHAHDWQGGFAPAYLAYQGAGAVKSVITVHNIAFQGWAPSSLMTELRLPAAQFHPAGLEYYGGLSSLKAGLVTADWITTVSPTYAAELMRPEFGMGLQGVIAARSARVSGILNGVDTAIWSPEAEAVPFSVKAMAGKAEARATLCADFGLDVPGPLAIVVSRLTDQKGIDLLPHVVPEFIAAGGGLIVLGSGDPALEAAVRGLADDHPGRVAVRIGYNEALSHQMFAGADAVLVPSRFEPCGLTQMYGLRYGTVPVVAATGGLADTVIGVSPATLAAGVATGVVFHPTDALAFGQALTKLVEVYGQPKLWAQVQKNAMMHPVGWETSAAAYAALYGRLLA
ncbi:MAG: glycogen synthase GlgA [Pseudotabrizicola sp.]|uniref:glycogen synthase GlgA n=1 Tax=Pseudotabrizicola sp. TaxID=2939647 RepID=UPI00272F0EB6|nr:glycogen synthase GlgA [Pseudotabrizicola sp.]MDP2082721.1 glycogen synthase GlgA [Pseudotabrizicola sp.]MDZ7576306.1 glycogen synthase GlgA [Pseudotabrizicola sp.]